MKALSEHKRTIIYIIILLIVTFGHYYFMQMSLESFRYIRQSTISMLSLLCLCGAFMIIAQKKVSRADILFAFMMIMVGLSNLLSLIKGLTTGYAGVVEYKFMSLPMLIYGIIYSFIFLLYPIEAFRPGWLTIKRTIILFLPTILIILLYILEVKIINTTAPVFDNWASFISESGRFYIALRLLVLVYPVFGVLIMLRYRGSYIEWCENNYASMENIDIKWLGDYIFANLVITLSCEVVVLSNNIRSVLMHNIIFLVFFLYGFYRILFRKNPYPEDYFKESMNERDAQIREELQASADVVLIAENDLIINNSFKEKQTGYKAKLDEWMLTEKPYLRKDFKLIDAMEILPLNRSYLSRLFNEGYGESFYHFVMRYRLEESKRLLLTRPDLTITRIAELSGFSSLSVFGRAFTQEMNCSPMQWREKEMKTY
jgi:AraC-like DNA-binding protein